MFSVLKIKRSFEEWTTERGWVLFTWSIINPNGPTLNCIGLRECGEDDQIEVFYRWMHFLGGETYILGYVDGSQTPDEMNFHVLEVLKHAFSLDDPRVFSRFPLVSAVPSFVSEPKMVVSNSDFYELLTASPTFRDADWGAQLYYLSKYKSDFFGRGAEETRNALEMLKRDAPNTKESEDFFRMTELSRGHLPGFQNWKPNSYQSRGLQAGDTEQWWAAIHDEEFVPQCSYQLAQAWVGAVYQFQYGDSSRDIAEPFEAANTFLKNYGHSLWPAEWTSEFLRGLMKLE